MEIGPRLSALRVSGAIARDLETVYGGVELMVVKLSNPQSPTTAWTLSSNLPEKDCGR